MEELDCYHKCTGSYVISKVNCNPGSLVNLYPYNSNKYNMLEIKLTNDYRGIPMVFSISSMDLPVKLNINSLDFLLYNSMEYFKDGIPMAAGYIYDNDNLTMNDWKLSTFDYESKTIILEDMFQILYIIPRNYGSNVYPTHEEENVVWLIFTIIALVAIIALIFLQFIRVFILKKC